MELSICLQIVHQRLELRINIEQKMLKAADKEAKMTLLAAVIINFGAGVLGIWGSVNIYFLSYLRMQGTLITQQTNSILLLCSLVPAGIMMLFTNVLTKKYGYLRVIQLCGLVFFIAPLCLNFVLNIATLLICVFFLPATAFGLSCVPVMNCLWSQFPHHRNTVSGITFFAFSVGGICWNILLLALVNPTNLKTNVDQLGIAYFGHEITQRLYLGLNAVYATSGISLFIGSLLIRRKDTNDLPSQKLPNQKLPQANQNPHSPKQLLPNNYANEVCQVVVDQKLTNLYQANRSLKSYPTADTPNPNTQCKLPTQQFSLVKLRVGDGLRDIRFQILFLCTLFCPLFQIYLGMNMKLIYMPLLNDDHFIAICMVVSTMSSTLGGLVWGTIADAHGFRRTLLYIGVLDISIKFFGLFATAKPQVMILSVGLGFVDKALLITEGPGLVEIFGLDLATQLLPYKSLAIFISFILAPTINLCFGGICNSQNILFVYFAFSLLSFSLFITYFRVSKTMHQAKSEDQDKKVQHQQNGQKVKKILKVEKIGSTQKVEKILKIESRQNVQNVEKIESTLKVEKILKVESIQNVQKVEIIQNVQKIESTLKVENEDNEQIQKSYQKQQNQQKVQNIQRVTYANK